MNFGIVFNGHPLWDSISVNGSFMRNCWEWKGSLDQGKAVFYEDGRKLSAPRYLWNQICEPKLQPKHHLSYCLRGNGACVSPLHRRYYRTDLEHIEAYILRSNNSDECSVWAGSFFRDGYPAIWIGSKSRRAHRAYWEAIHGEIPAGQVIMHDCDLRSCLVHLRRGSSEENIRDMWRRGRSRLQRERQGEWLNVMGGLFPGELITHGTFDI